MYTTFFQICVNIFECAKSAIHKRQQAQNSIRTSPFNTPNQFVSHQVMKYYIYGIEQPTNYFFRG